MKCATSSGRRICAATGTGSALELLLDEINITNVQTLRVDGADGQSLLIFDVPGLPATNGFWDVEIYAQTGGAVENTTWGRLKARFR